VPKDPRPSDLVEMYDSLYQKARVAEHQFSGRKAEYHDPTQLRATISYNLAMTTTTMAICPRISEGARLTSEDGSDLNNGSEVALNGTILAGTLMVKAEEDRDNLCQNPALLTGLLRSIGVPPTDELTSSK